MSSSEPVIQSRRTTPQSRIRLGRIEFGQSRPKNLAVGCLDLDLLETTGGLVHAQADETFLVERIAIPIIKYPFAVEECLHMIAANLYRRQVPAVRRHGERDRTEHRIQALVLYTQFGLGIS